MASHALLKLARGVVLLSVVESQSLVNSYITHWAPPSTRTCFSPGMNSDTAPTYHPVGLLRQWAEALNPQYGPTPCIDGCFTQPRLWHPCALSRHWDCLSSNGLFQQELKPCSDAIFIAVRLKKQVDMENSNVQSKKKKKAMRFFHLQEKINGSGQIRKFWWYVHTVAIVPTVNKCGFHKLKYIYNYSPISSAVSQVTETENSNFKWHFNF